MHSRNVSVTICRFSDNKRESHKLLIPKVWVGMPVRKEGGVWIRLHVSYAQERHGGCDCHSARAGKQYRASLDTGPTCGKGLCFPRHFVARNRYPIQLTVNFNFAPCSTISFYSGTVFVAISVVIVSLSDHDVSICMCLVF